MTIHSNIHMNILSLKLYRSSLLNLIPLHSNANNTANDSIKKYRLLDIFTKLIYNIYPSIENHYK